MRKLLIGMLATIWLTACGMPVSTPSTRTAATLQAKDAQVEEGLVIDRLYDFHTPTHNYGLLSAKLEGKNRAGRLTIRVAGDALQTVAVWVNDRPLEPQAISDLAQALKQAKLGTGVRPASVRELAKWIEELCPPLS